LTKVCTEYLCTPAVTHKQTPSYPEPPPPPPLPTSVSETINYVDDNALINQLLAFLEVRHEVNIAYSFVFYEICKCCYLLAENSGQSSRNIWLLRKKYGLLVGNLLLFDVIWTSGDNIYKKK
jgi:hypothetical protein